MKIIITILSIISLYQACSLSSDWIAPSIKEAAELAGAVIVGRVKEHINPNSFIISEIILENAVYYKGCGPRQVKISGYSQSSMCGIDAPKVGTEVMVFVCRNPKGEWSLHKYTAYAGQYLLKPDSVSQLPVSLDRPNTCESEYFVYRECKKRDPSVKRKPMVYEEPKLIPQIEKTNNNPEEGNPIFEPFPGTPIINEPKPNNNYSVINRYIPQKKKSTPIMYNQPRDGKFNYFNNM